MRAAEQVRQELEELRKRIQNLPNEKRLAHCPLPERDAAWDLFRSLDAAEE